MMLLKGLNFCKFWLHPLKGEFKWISILKKITVGKRHRTWNDINFLIECWLVLFWTGLLTTEQNDEVLPEAEGGPSRSQYLSLCGEPTNRLGSTTIWKTSPRFYNSRYMYNQFVKLLGQRHRETSLLTIKSTPILVWFIMAVLNKLEFVRKISVLIWQCFLFSCRE